MQKKHKMLIRFVMCIFAILPILFLINVVETGASNIDDIGTCVNYDTGIDTASDQDRTAIAAADENQGGDGEGAGDGGDGGDEATSQSEIGVGVTIPSTDPNYHIESMRKYSYDRYIKGIYAFSIKVAVALCTLMVIYAGYKYLTSKGETSMINEAKDILFSTLMGAALLMLVLLIGNISGFDTTEWFSPQENNTSFIDIGQYS